MLHARLPCIGAASSSVLRTHAPAPDEAPVAWAEGRGAAFPQAHAGVTAAAPRAAARERRLWAWIRVDTCTRVRHGS